MRNVDQVRCDEAGINAHFDGASGAFTATPPDGEAKAGGASIDQVIRKSCHPNGMPPGMVPTLIGGTFQTQSRQSLRSQLQRQWDGCCNNSGASSRSFQPCVWCDRTG